VLPGGPGTLDGGPCIPCGPCGPAGPAGPGGPGIGTPGSSFAL